mgnify:CR=1 FL=1
MARLTNTLLTDAFADSRKAPMLDLSQGGQNGFQTDFSTYVSNTAYVKRNLKAFLMEAPEGFQDTANPSKWVAILKSLVELHPKSIEGLAGGLTVEVVENAAGGGGRCCTRCWRDRRLCYHEDQHRFRHLWLGRGGPGLRQVCRSCIWPVPGFWQTDPRYGSVQHRGDLGAPASPHFLGHGRRCCHHLCYGCHR